MAKSIAFAADASRLASLLLSYIPAVCAFVAPRHPGASFAIVDRFSRSRTLSPKPSPTLARVQVHLIDGTFELFRAFFAVPSSRGRDGAEIGAARGMLRGFAAWLASGEVTHVACAFDHVIESFRNELFDGYKTGDGIDPALYSQFALAERVTRALGIVTWPMIDFEADDAIATAAYRFAELPEVTRVVIASPDKDLAQCVVSEKIVCWDRLRNNWLDRAGVVTKFGVSAESIPDYLALVGDTADGIP